MNSKPVGKDFINVDFRNHDLRGLDSRPKARVPMSTNRNFPALNQSGKTPANPLNTRQPLRGVRTPRPDTKFSTTPTRFAEPKSAAISAKPAPDCGQPESTVNSAAGSKPFQVPRRKVTIQRGDWEMEFSEDDDEIYMDQIVTSKPPVKADEPAKWNEKKKTGPIVPAPTFNMNNFPSLDQRQNTTTDPAIKPKSNKNSKIDVKSSWNHFNNDKVPVPKYNSQNWFLDPAIKPQRVPRTWKPKTPTQSVEPQSETVQEKKASPTVPEKTLSVVVEEPPTQSNSDCPSGVVQEPVPTVFPITFGDVGVLKEQKGPSPVVFLEPKKPRPATAEEPAERNEKEKTPNLNGNPVQKDNNTAALQQENSALKVELKRLNKVLQQKDEVLSLVTRKMENLEKELKCRTTFLEKAKNHLSQMQQQKSETETEAALAQSQRLLKEKEEEHVKETTSLKATVEQLKQQLQAERSLMEKEKTSFHEKTRENVELTKKIHQLEENQTLKRTANEEEERLQWQKEKTSFLQEISQLKQLVQEKDNNISKSEEEYKRTLQEMDKLKDNNQVNSKLISKVKNLEASLWNEKVKTNEANSCLTQQMEESTKLKAALVQTETDLRNQMQQWKTEKQRLLKEYQMESAKIHDALMETKKQQAEDKQKWDEEKSSLSQEISQLQEDIKRKDGKLDRYQKLFTKKIKQLQEQVDELKEKTKKKSRSGFLSFFKRSSKKD
ncbi:centrosomal protein of 164 kDa [Oryzias melastigma]|uniref:centrosomal protein of 164 kDa n=1 Tax=Oryzias melastigma TaxID=30732 RepID=UPI00168CE544|nr:centrosomal protein of 164 kDa [Oryzias melastigma]